MDDKLYDALMQQVRYRLPGGDLVRAIAEEVVDQWIGYGFDIGAADRARFIHEAELYATRGKVIST